MAEVGYPSIGNNNTKQLTIIAVIFNLFLDLVKGYCYNKAPTMRIRNLNMPAQAERRTRGSRIFTILNVRWGRG